MVSASDRVGIFGAEVFLKVIENTSQTFLGEVIEVVVLEVDGHHGQGECRCLSLGEAEVAREVDFDAVAEVTSSLAVAAYRDHNFLGHLDRDLALFHRVLFVGYCPPSDRAASPALCGVLLLLQLSLLQSMEIGQPGPQWPSGW